MHLPLSYPSFRCVLEHLEAVKRAHIIARAPGLQKVDKLIPLRLGNLNIGLYFLKKTLIINKLSIICENDEVEFKMNGKTFSRKGLASRKDRTKKILNFYFCGRSITNVDKLNLRHGLFPDVKGLNMKLRVNSLYAIVPEDFKTAWSFIDSRSFPFKTVATIPRHLGNHIVTSAETLILNLSSGLSVTLDQLKKLNNKKVVFECFSNSYYRVGLITLIPLIKYHIETKQDIRTTFVISTGDRSFLIEKLITFELAFRVYRSDLDDVNERFIPGLLKFSIPINNESRIQVYAIEDPEEDCPYKLIVKPVLGL